MEINEKYLQDKLYKGIDYFMNPERIDGYLSFVSKIFNLDYKNQILCYIQAPHTKMVASKKAWEKDGETVKDNAHVIYGLRPIILRKNNENSNFLYDIEDKTITFIIAEDTDYKKTDKCEMNIENAIKNAFKTKNVIIDEYHSSDKSRSDEISLRTENEIFISLNGMLQGKKRERAILDILVDYITYSYSSDIYSSDIGDISRALIMYALEIRYDLPHVISPYMLTDSLSKLTHNEKEMIFAQIQKIILIVICLLETEVLDFTETVLLKQIAPHKEILTDDMDEFTDIINTIIFLDTEKSTYYKDKLKNILDIFVRINKKNRQKMIDECKSDDGFYTFPPVILNTDCKIADGLVF